MLLPRPRQPDGWHIGVTGMRRRHRVLSLRVRRRRVESAERYEGAAGVKDQADGQAAWLFSDAFRSRVHSRRPSLTVR